MIAEMMELCVKFGLLDDVIEAASFYAVSFPELTASADNLNNNCVRIKILILYKINNWATRAQELVDPSVLTQKPQDLSRYLE